MNFVFRNFSIYPYSVANGADASFRVPLYCDAAQQFLISGYGWRPGPTPPVWDSGEVTFSTPIMLPPWTEFISVSVRAIGTDVDPSIVLRLRNSDDTATISLQDVTVEGLGISDDPADFDEYEWCGGEQWTAGGSVGQSTPDGDASMLQVTPTNGYVLGFINAVVSDAVVYEMLYRTFASRAAIS